LQTLPSLFEAKFRAAPRGSVRSPLRICPLGAHVDHQGGVVTGMALSEGVDLVYSATDDGYVRVQSLDFPDEEYFHVDQPPGMIPGFWGSYLRGATRSLSRAFKLRRGLNAVVRGRLPIGGLSSSAAVTTAYLMALCDVNELDVTPTDLIHFSHWVERGFIGLNNGILDQSANILSRARHLMLMDCKDEGHELVPQAPDMPEFEVAIVYSGISTSLIQTDYNNRVAECKVAAWILQELCHGRVSPFNDAILRDIPDEAYAEYRSRLPGRFLRRADHFFGELERVRRGVEAWKAGDLPLFGQLVFESGTSSIENYECGCPELITIYEILRSVPGVYGARFSGAGYRGCCVGLIDPACRAELEHRVDAEYPSRHPAHRDTYRTFFCGVADGARRAHY
jgi:galacturonokinase